MGKSSPQEEGERPEEISPKIRGLTKRGIERTAREIP